MSTPKNLNLVTAALAIHASKINLIVAVGTAAHIINGQFVTRAAAASQAWTVSENSGVYGDPGNGAFTGTVGGSTRLFGLFMNAAGTLTVKPGPIVNTAKLAAGEAALHFPQELKDNVCFGAVRVAVTANTTFVPGVTAQDAAGVTTTYVNLACVPSEPLRS
jgi:hypothetical protein